MFNEDQAGDSLSHRVATDRNSPDLVIDWEHLHLLSDDNQEFEAELLQIFIQDCHAHLQAVRVAIEQGDSWKVEQEAHHIKGASANVGAKMLQATAAKLEKQAHDRRLEEATLLAESIMNAFVAFQTLIANQ